MQWLRRRNYQGRARKIETRRGHFSPRIGRKLVPLVEIRNFPRDRNTLLETTVPQAASAKRPLTVPAGLDRPGVVGLEEFKYFSSRGV